MVIRKIKRVKEEILVVLSKTLEGINFNGDVRAEPLPEYLKLLDSLKPFVIEMCELGKKSTITISGISFSYHGEMDTQAAIITFQKKLSDGNAVITINTPLKYVERTGEDTPVSQVMSQEMAEVMDKITKGAIEFVKGLRKQTDLFQ